MYLESCQAYHLIHSITLKSGYVVLVLHPVEDGSDCVFGFVCNSFVGFFEQFGDIVNFLQCM